VEAERDALAAQVTAMQEKQDRLEYRIVHLLRALEARDPK
ncbi:hypothetical protein KIPB_000831, partial [Kipferlia bialata]